MPNRLASDQVVGELLWGRVRDGCCFRGGWGRRRGEIPWGLWEEKGRGTWGGWGGGGGRYLDEEAAGGGQSPQSRDSGCPWAGTLGMSGRWEGGVGHGESCLKKKPLHPTPEPWYLADEALHLSHPARSIPPGSGPLDSASSSIRPPPPKLYKRISSGGWGQIYL